MPQNRRKRRRGKLRCARESRSATLSLFLARIRLKWLAGGLEQSEPQEQEDGAEQEEEGEEGGGESKGSRLEYEDGGIGVEAGMPSRRLRDVDSLSRRFCLSLLTRRSQTKWTQALSSMDHGERGKQLPRRSSHQNGQICWPASLALSVIARAIATECEPESRLCKRLIRRSRVFSTALAQQHTWVPGRSTAASTVMVAASTSTGEPVRDASGPSVCPVS